MCEISVIVPFYNDAKSCIKLVNSYIKSFTQLEISYEFIIVDDCSTQEKSDELSRILKLQSTIFIYRLNKNFGQYGALAFGISKAKGKLLLITDQDIVDLPTSDLENLIQKSNDFDLQYIFQSEDKRGIIRSVFSSLWHLFIVMNTRSKKTLENPLPFRLVHQQLKARLIEHNYTITTLDIALLKYGNRYSFYKIDVNNPLLIKTKSEYSLMMLFKIGIYSIISIIIDLKVSFMLLSLLIAISFGIGLHSLTLLFVSILVSSLIFGIAFIIKNEQSFKSQVKQIEKCVEQ